MKLEQMYTGCLAQGAYYIASEGEAVIIDPLRETAPYIERAKKDGVKIKYILETHFHADFVSGHVDLAQKTGATIVYGPMAKPHFEAYIAKDNEILKVGNLSIKVLHTPGHTMESSCFLLLDEEGREHALYSGDTLFLGDVGRPDLAVKTHLTEADLAGHLYDSLRQKVMTLPDEVIVYPGHGAGSACGKNMRKETVGTIGEEKASNYALRADMTKEEFVKEVTSGLTQAPQYFAKNAMMNQQAIQGIDAVLDQGLNALPVDEFEMLASQKEILVLDTRAPQEFKNNFIAGAMNIGIDGSFAPWVGALISDLKQPIILIAEIGREKEVVTRLARVGYDNVLGYLEGEMEAWIETGRATKQIKSIPATEFEKHYANDNITILDVRKNSEYVAEHVIEAQNFPLDNLAQAMTTLDKSATYYIHCAGGYRSMIASSILKANGFNQLIDVAGGFRAIAATNIPKTAYVCPSTLN